MEEGLPQFKAEINFEGGKIVWQADQPRNMGGTGNNPGPLHYCFFGLLACYTATFAAVSSLKGIKLKKLAARLETGLDFSRVFGLSPEAIMKEVNILLQVDSDATWEKLEEVEKLAQEGCPAVYALTQPIKLKGRLEPLPTISK